MGIYLKAILAVAVSTAGAVVVALGTGNTDVGDINTQTWLISALAVLGSGGLVWFTENGPWHAYIKTVMAFLAAGVGALVVALDDNVITQAEWLTAFSAAVVATGLVYQASNKSSG
jgi:hypothetical protein